MPRLPEGGTAARALADPLPDAGSSARIGRLLRGDRDALAELFVAHGDLVYRCALRLTRSRHDAEDVTQEVFVRLPAIVGGFTGTASSFPGWLRRVAVREALVHMRRGRRRREVEVDGVMSLLAPAAHPIERMSIDVALGRLSDEHRTVFLLKEVEGYSHAEIAGLLGITTANSEVRLHRARRALRELLGGSR